MSYWKNLPSMETPLNAEKISINSEKISLEGYTTNKINVIKKRRNK